MRTHDIKKVCIEDNEPLKKAIVAQGYSKTQHLIRHSSNPTCIEPFINSIKYPTAKSCNSPYMDRLDKSRLGVVCLCKEHHELDPGDVNNSCKNMTDCSEELSDKNPVEHEGFRIFSILHEAGSRVYLKTMKTPKFQWKDSRLMSLETLMMPRTQIVG